MYCLRNIWNSFTDILHSILSLRSFSFLLRYVNWSLDSFVKELNCFEQRNPIHKNVVIFLPFDISATFKQNMLNRIILFASKMFMSLFMCMITPYKILNWIASSKTLMFHFISNQKWTGFLFKIGTYVFFLLKYCISDISFHLT